MSGVRKDNGTQHQRLSHKKYFEFTSFTQNQNILCARVLTSRRILIPNYGAYIAIIPVVMVMIFSGIYSFICYHFCCNTRITRKIAGKTPYSCGVAERESTTQDDLEPRAFPTHSLIVLCPSQRRFLIQVCPAFSLSISTFFES